MNFIIVEIFISEMTLSSTVDVTNASYTVNWISYSYERAPNHHWKEAHPEGSEVGGGEGDQGRDERGQAQEPGDSSIWSLTSPFPFQGEGAQVECEDHEHDAPPGAAKKPMLTVQMTGFKD